MYLDVREILFNWLHKGVRDKCGLLLNQHGVNFLRGEGGVPRETLFRNRRVEEQRGPRITIHDVRGSKERSVF